MKIVVAPTSFKGSIDVIGACIAIIRGIREVEPQADIKQLPLSDGGDGFIESLLFNCGGDFFDVVVTDPRGKRRETVCGLLENGTGIVEMAKASGLVLLGKHEKNPLQTTSYGTGELIKALIEKDVKKIVLGVGGSATIDMGVGCMQALGVKFLDESGNDVEFGGKELAKIKRIDVSQMSDSIRNVELIVAADVKNVLLGNEGAVFTYGKQKGLFDKDVSFMEKAMKNVAEVIKKEFDRNVTTVISGGAAGGIAAGLYGVLNADVRSGIELFFEISGFTEKVRDADMVITGEGRIDIQTGYGKAAEKVLKFGEERNIFVLVLTGEITENGEKLFKKGKSFGFSITPPDLTFEEAKERVEELLQQGTAKALHQLNKVISK
ncbi:MAG: glycerate kinase [Candidatus Cloacimonadota bacterium]|nr:MAG: glycerate kinase [Candidatus Cloacimonadota bacterium]